MAVGNLVGISLTFVCLYVLTVSGEEGGRKLRVHIATWNVNAGEPGDGIEELAGLGTSEPLPDIIVIGLQEVTMSPHKVLIQKLFSDSWTKALVPELAKWGYSKVETIRLVGVQMNVFVHLQHDASVHSIAMDKIRTGFGGWYGNKGAVMVSMTVYDTRVRFVNCHLPAHDEQLQARIDHYKWIRESLNDPLPPNVWFWFGDLNFRLEDTTVSAELIRKMVDKGDLNTLLDMDQLRDLMDHDVAFRDFTELPISFKPTFKMIPMTDEYNMKRRPAWTDRIMYQDTEKIQPVFYKSLEHLRYSDHRPVVAQFIVDV